jgi:SAM-dependent methyltransferase
MTNQQRQPADNWANGAAYEPYVGRWSRLVAREFLTWLALPNGLSWLDVGCGTGALSDTILKQMKPARVTGIDPSEYFVSYAQHHVRNERIAFKVGDARSIPAETSSYDAVVSGFVLNFVPQPDQAAAEMSRVVRQGGTIAAYVWDYAGKMQFMRHFWNAAIALDPQVAAQDEGRRFPLCHPDALLALFQAANLANIEVRAIDIDTNFKDFDDYWSPFLGGQGPAPSYVMSLSEDHRMALRERLRSSLPLAIDGSIPLVARAWAVRGISQA